MPEYNIDYTLVSTGRTNIKNEVVDLFQKEVPGTGRGDLTSKYTYTVESFRNYRIILQRPAALNKGFDFVVHVITPNNDRVFLSNSGLRAQSFPTHNNIVESLSYAKIDDTTNYNEQVKPIIKTLFKGEKFDHNLSDITLIFKDHNGLSHPIIVILLAIKWLFIEQDITYWNWSGRQMLYDLLTDNDLV